MALGKKVLLAIIIFFTLLLAYKFLAPEVRESNNSLFESEKLFVTADNTQSSVNVGPKNIQFSVDVANTDASRQLGLSGRSRLDQSKGMVFVFDQPKNACFWMKDMKFDIDILWFDEDRKLVNIKKEATPVSYPESYCSGQPAKYVLEILAGSVDRYEFKLGDKLSQL